MKHRRVVGVGRTGRRAIGIGVVTGVVVAAAVTLPMAASATPEARTTDGFAPAADAAIVPGVELTIPLSGGPASCTANYLFRPGGDTGAHGPVDHGPGDHGTGDHGTGDHGTGDHEPGDGGYGDGRAKPWGDGSAPATDKADGSGHDKGHPGEHGTPEKPSGGDVYLGTAAHCVSDGPATNLDGCDEANIPLPLGTPITVTGRDGEEYTATVAYNSWATMQKAGETDPAVCQFNDFAYLRLDPGDVAEANPSVPEFGGPVGIDSDGTTAGDLVYSYQPNQLTATPAKRGISLGQPMGPFTHVVATLPPGVSGDSGSGYLDGDGTAFGVLSSEFLSNGTPNGLNGVSDLSRALQYANEVGEMGDVGLVDGTEPFSPDGLTMTPLPTLPQQLPGPMEQVQP